MSDRHAYLIMAHDNPEQLKKLIHALDDARNDIYVHIDAGAAFGEEDLGISCTSSNLCFITPKIRAHWGGYSLIRIEMALLENAVRNDYAYLHLLSGMDLPIKSQSCIHEFFDTHKGKEFINFWHMKKKTGARCRYYTPFPEGAGDFGLNLLNNAVKGILMVLGIKMNRDVDFRYGSQWFSITGAMAKYAVSQKAWVEKTFRHTNTCDEIFMATLVWNSPYRNSVFDPTEYSVNSTEGNTSNMRFIDWSRGESVRHPWTFVSDDFELLRNVPHLWARKFDEKKDPVIIDRVLKNLI